MYLPILADSGTLDYPDGESADVFVYCQSTEEDDKELADKLRGKFSRDCYSCIPLLGGLYL